MKRLAISANRTLHIFNVEDLIYFTVSADKSNSSEIILTGERRITVHKSISELHQLFTPIYGNNLVKVTRDACVNLNSVYELSYDGVLRLIDHKNDKNQYKILIPSRNRIAELMKILMGNR